MTRQSPPERILRVDRLTIEIHSDREKMGVAAAYAVAKRIKEVIADKVRAAMVFAAAPSQNEFLATLGSLPDIAWDKVIAFHMDEYISLPPDAPQGFGNFLRERLFEPAKPGTVHYLNGQASDPEEECKRYAALLEAHPVDIVCAGIGENGHLAFNDPPVADFADPEKVKVVKLDETCRMQQVHDGCFPDFDSVPTHAITMTIPALMAARWIYTVVPGPTKAQAIKDTLTGPIGAHCPATALRQHPDSILFIDRDSASLL